MTTSSASIERYKCSSYYQIDECREAMTLSSNSSKLVQDIAEKTGQQFKLFRDRFTIELVPIDRTRAGSCCFGSQIVRQLDWTGRAIYKERLIKSFNRWEFEALEEKPKRMDQILVLEFEYIGFPSMDIPIKGE